MAADYFSSGHFRLSMPMGIDKNVLHKIRLFYYSQNLNIFCSLDPCLNASHLLRYLGTRIKLLKLGFMDIDADRRN